MKWLQRAIAQRHSDEGIALPSVILLIVVVGMLAITVMGVILAQVTPTIFSQKNSRTVTAAEAGIAAALGEIRAAVAPDPVNGEILGNSRALPCSAAGTVTGSGGDLKYQVNIRYYKIDPTNMDEAWRNNNKMSCFTQGTITGVPVTPSYALITSAGTDAQLPERVGHSANRTMQTIYRFDVSNYNISGGIIFAYGTAFCLVADEAKEGSAIRYVAANHCQEDTDLNMWSWLEDYRLHLSSTDVAGDPLCISGQPSGNNTVEAKLQRCQADGVAGDALGQYFSWESGARFKGQNAANTARSEKCLHAKRTGDADKTIREGDPLLVTPCGDGEAVEWRSFKPDARLGAGGASYATGQIVSAQEFGRCFDVYEEHVYTDSGKDSDGYVRDYNLLYTCKQDPSGTTGVFWNHKWIYTEPPKNIEGVYAGEISNQNIYVNSPRGKVCLLSPAGTGNGLTVGFEIPYAERNSYSSGRNCNDARAKWTRRADTGDSSTSWTFVDYRGRCMSIGRKVPKNNYAWSAPAVAACDGSNSQKWNAPREMRGAGVDAYREPATSLVTSGG
ncbi:hypothetical protein SAMN06309944_0024 [Micrococcales bacterium KH10]|nr:hypothetical protein SAMN06309944_0024 [Micrococcales bacterium KH10]